ncbi:MULTISPECIES: MFS transporter [Actinopolyspora]|uniref:Putative proline/betaine transporter n=1 Tax=Actinopolyspora saharensis TaxID=995062 RepID=A0A1H1DQE2_9ACTN|nr:MULTISPECIES: MFS transporter [Actinopolyspora]NHD18394.1 MHS family MFS transporter [Actinopolyspora sp. BKK2]NHE77647.1 MHS family MFS transporter [Actinopolyspora sp. BKK1]SDQ78725.1 metabolite-proton symporter [Actinopolyspora saharensis]
MAGSTTTQSGRVALASLIGTTIEWYDFFIYGTAASLVFNELFFPSFDPLVGALAAFASFAIGFLARPLGGVVFSHFGDRLGRKPMLIWSLMLMGVATLLIGTLPAYGSIGVWAPVLLVLLRFAQGIGVGGEWGGAALMAVEHAPDKRRGFYGAWPQVGVPAGLLLGNMTFSLVSASVTDEQFMAWGWRIPFLMSAVLIVLGLFIRLKISESPVFERVMRTKEKSRVPVVEALRSHPRTILLATGTFLGTHATFYITSTWLVFYTTEEGLFERTTVLNANSLLSFVDIPFMLAFGLLSDYLGRRRMMISGMGVMALFALPYMLLVDSGSIVLYLLGGMVLQLCRTSVYGPQSAYYSELFSTRLRYSGISISYQLASILGGGIAPMICTGLYAATGSPVAIAGYMAVLAVISCGSAYLLTETYKRDLAEPAAAREVDGEPTASG